MRKLLLMLFLVSALAQAKEVETNNIYIGDAPAWVTRPRVEKIVARIQTRLEWDIRKVTVTFYQDAGKFQKAHHLGPSIIAASVKNTNSIHLGPRVGDGNFDSVFAHELVHVILYQKYRDAIPKWLEEGLANHLGQNDKVDYKWLASKPFPQDVRAFSHPASGGADEIHYRYAVSQALIEMIASKCDLTNLLRLSVGMKMENYLVTYCEIPDLNAAFQKWLKRKAQGAAPL